MNIYDTIKENNIENGNKIAMSITIDDGTHRKYTYSETFDRVDVFVKKLSRAGIIKGDRIAIMAENSPEWNIAYLAVMKIHATAVLIDASLMKIETLELIQKSDVRCIFTSPNLVEKMGKDLPKQIPLLNLYDQAEPFEMYGSGILSNMASTVDGDSSIANIIYSSGTTRSAAGIMHTHESIIKTTGMTIDAIGLKSDERFIGILPTSHIYGVICLVMGPLMLGAHVHYIESLSSENIMRAFSELKPTIFPGVPKAFDLFKSQIMNKIQSDDKTSKLFNKFFPICYKVRKKTKINLGKIIFKSIQDGFGGQMRILCSAGAPMDPETAKFYFGCGFNLLVTYGSTETNIPTIGNRMDNMTMDTCGKPYGDITVKLSELGEILIKSPYVMKGYFRDEEATGNAFDEERWFKSGDIGQVDESGNISIIGRLKENIVLSTGKKVTPDDIERHYTGIVGISEFVISGIPVEDGSYDEVHAFVVLEENADKVAAEKEIKHKGSELSVNMKITKVHFMDEIPKTSLQKPKRFLLKKKILEDREKEESGYTNNSGSCSNNDIIEKHKRLEMNALNEKIDFKKRNASSSNEEKEQLLKELIAKISNTEASSINNDTKLFKELAIDSLSTIELADKIENMFNINVDRCFTKDMSVGDLLLVIETPYDYQIKHNYAIEEQYPKQKKLSDYNLFNIVRNITKSIYRIHVKNEHKIPEQTGYIICANHVSNFDYLYLTLNFRKERFSKFCCMAKKELFNTSALSKKLAEVCGMVPVDRGGINCEMMKSLKDKLKENWGVLIHPEGTRSTNGKLGELKNGAAMLAIEAGVPVVPAYINGAYEIYPKGKKLPNLFNWKKMKKYQVEVTYGEPISSLGLTIEELTEKINESILNLQKIQVA